MVTLMTAFGILMPKKIRELILMLEKAGFSKEVEKIVTEIFSILPGQKSLFQGSPVVVPSSIKRRK